MLSLATGSFLEVAFQYRQAPYDPLQPFKFITGAPKEINLGTWKW
jgi:hypothetical protein